MPRLLRLTTAAACAFALAAGADAADPEGYIHNIYLTTSLPTMSRQGHWVFDISTPERMDDMIGELARLGVNAMTYHSAYRSDGADYTPRHPELKRAPRWPADAQPVGMFLDICARYGIAGYLAVFIYPEMDVRVARLASEDLAHVFRGRPGMAGYVPPIEGSSVRGIDNATFLDICRRVKQIDPTLLVMDYPNGPYTAEIVQTVVARGASGCIDVENVQFHGADERLRNFVVSRGMTHLVMGMSARCRSIVHTHYKYGGAKHWLKPADSYKVRQEAVLTATPHGTSIFSFQHGFWGFETGPGTGDALWRRLVWYEGIVAVQRIAPILSNARPIAAAAVVIPANTTEGGQQLVERYWLPLTRSRVFTQMFAYQNQLAERTRLIVCPSLEACDEQQRGQLEALVRAGRTLVLPSASEPTYAKGVPERTRRILGLASPGKIDAAQRSPEFLAALGGLTEAGRVRAVDKLAEKPFGEGRVVRMPGDAGSLDAELPRLADRYAGARVQAANLPDGYMLELWQARAALGHARFILILSTEQGLAARDVTLTIPWHDPAPPVWFFDRDRADRLESHAADRVLKVRVPKVNDEYGLVLLGTTAEPTLRPSCVMVRTKVGGVAWTPCRITNTTAKPCADIARISIPKVCARRKKWTFDYRLEPGESALWETGLRMLPEAERRPYFVLFQHSGSTKSDAPRPSSMSPVQRCIVFPADGRPQVISRQEPPAPPPARGKANAEPKWLTEHWLGVTAGEPYHAQFDGNVPGVCFFPKSREWDPPAEHKGKVARYGEVILRLAGANFFVNNPDPAADLEIRLTFCANNPGQLQAYDGVNYHPVGAVPKAEEWTTATFRVPRELVASPKVDKNSASGVNMLFDVRVDGIYVHRIEARTAPTSK